MEASYAGFAFGNGSNDLYNGNIRHLVTAIEGMDILGTAYRYDQLQRLTQMTAYYNTNAANTWSGMSATTDYFNTFSYDQNGNIRTLQRNATATLGLYMDDFTYNYVGLDGNPNASSTSRSNRLNYVSDSGANDGVADDITNTQTTNNYLYDAIGQLLSDVDEGIDTMYWRYGDKKLRKIIRSDQNSAQLEFYYNPLGQRIIKLEKPRSSGVVLDTAEWVYTYYTYDANGQVMGVYQAQNENGPANDQAILEELNIYGSSRIGQIKPERTVWYNGEVYNGAPQVWQNILGEHSYEMTNHLGNVLAVVNDRKLWNATDTLYEAVLLMSSDYYPYGMTMPGRNSNSSDYRYGFNGYEGDDEVKGNGNSYTTQFRQYDPRLGRWLTQDPVFKPHESPYAWNGNNPIWFIDPNGADSAKVGGAWFWQVEKGDTYWSIGKRTGVGHEELQSLNSQKAENLKIGSLLMLSAPKQNITVDKESRGENISTYTPGQDVFQTSHLTPPLRTLMLGTNVLVSNITKNHLNTEISDSWSESQKQEFMKRGGYATASVLLMEFINGTGAETRRFGIDNNLTQYLKSSTTKDLAYQKWLTSSESQRAKGIYMAYSPDKGGNPSAHGLVGHFLGGTTWYFQQRGPNLDIKVVNSFNIESFNFFGRLEQMTTGKYSGIKSISRPSPSSNTIVPLGTTNQIFHWTE